MPQLQEDESSSKSHSHRDPMGQRSHVLYVPPMLERLREQEDMSNNEISIPWRRPE